MVSLCVVWNYHGPPGKLRFRKIMRLGGWWRLLVAGGLLVTGGRWWLLVANGGWRVVVAGDWWWLLASGGGWWLVASGGWWQNSLGIRVSEITQLAFRHLRFEGP